VRKAASVLTSLAVVAVALVLGPPAAEAAGTLTPWSSSAAVGSTFSASANGCPSLDEETETGFWYQWAELVVITGAGADARMAAVGQSVDGVRHRFALPGWIDPDQPAVIAGRCTKVSYSFDDGTESTEVLFTYADAAIDITPGAPPAAGPLVALERTTAAGGQVLRGVVTGCEGSQQAGLTLLQGTDLTLRTIEGFVGGSESELTGGQATVDIELNSGFGFGSVDAGPLPEGDYTLVASCATFGEDRDEGVFRFAAPVLVTVSGTNPSGSVVAQLSKTGDEVFVSGEGCTGGRTVALEWESAGYSEPGPVTARRLGKAIAARNVGDLGRLVEARSTADAASTSATIVPEADGSWSATIVPDETDEAVFVSASCGDPLGAGFAYVRRAVFLGGSFADVYVDRVSPTSSPAGGEVTVHLLGECEGGATAAFVDEDNVVLAESAPVELSYDSAVAVTLAAPATAGTYGLVASCETAGGGEPYEVFVPDERSGDPLAVEGTDGWPRRGAPELYEGRIGPIELPAMDMDMEKGASAKALGPSELFFDVPRPDGDYAITQIDIDLVDADGMPVDQTMAHLHHFVIANTSGKNPACPDGTFGLPGEIVGAAGAERTVLDLADPYGIVVSDADVWSGVYELMSRSMQDQEVFVTYDVTYRRDVENVRPVSRYFGSATGCGGYTWTVDGSGTPDRQSHFIEIAAAGRLVGGGAHIHNGATHADLVNDRGRRLCRSEITYGDEAVGHAMSRASAPRSGKVTETTVVDGPSDDAYPPEYYDDDLVIDSISTCALAEQVEAGERIRFDAVYENDRARSGVMGIFSLFVWEGGGPLSPNPPGATPIGGSPNYTG